MEINFGIAGCCSANLLHHLDHISVRDVEEVIAEPGEAKLLFAITGDSQKKAARVLKSCGFKSTERRTNPDSGDNYGITLWHRSTRPMQKKKKAKRGKRK